MGSVYTTTKHKKMRGLHSANSNSEMSGYPATMRFLRDSPVNLKAPNGVVWWWRCELISLRFHPVHNIWSRSSYAWCGLTRAHISKDGCHMMSLNSSGLNQQQKKNNELVESWTDLQQAARAVSHKSKQQVQLSSELPWNAAFHEARPGMPSMTVAEVI